MIVTAVSVVFAVMAVCRATSWKVKTALLVLFCLLHPMPAFWIVGWKKYHEPYPESVALGLFGVEGYNLFPDSRLQSVSSGCVYYFWPAAKHAFSNNAVFAMISLFGPPPRSYLGPYPTKEEVFAWMRHAPPTDPELLQNGVIQVDDGEIKIRVGFLYATTMANRQFDAFRSAGGIDPSGNQLSIHGRFYQSELLLLRFTQNNPDSPSAESDFVLLIEAQNGRPFAVYNLGKSSSMSRWLLPDLLHYWQFADFSDFQWGLSPDPFSEGPPIVSRIAPGPLQNH